MNTSSKKSLYVPKIFHSLNIRMLLIQVYLCTCTKDSLFKCTEMRGRTEDQQNLTTFLYKTGLSKNKVLLMIYLIPPNRILLTEFALTIELPNLLRSTAMVFISTTNSTFLCMVLCLNLYRKRNCWQQQTKRKCFRVRWGKEALNHYDTLSLKTIWELLNNVCSALDW